MSQSLALAATRCLPTSSGRQQYAAAATATAGRRAACPPLRLACHDRYSTKKQRFAAAAAALPEVAAAELAPEAQEQWAACVEMLQGRCGLEAEAADACLLKAFGWKGQGFWRQERVKDTPCPQQVEAALDFLQELGIVGDDAAKLVAAFPEALGLQVSAMEENVGVLRDKWFMKGNVLVNAIKRKPRVLGNCIDCQGTCAGLCTRCWAQF